MIFKKHIEGGFYELKLTERISLLSLNTNLWYKSNRQVQDLTDPAQQFRFFSLTLSLVSFGSVGWKGSWLRVREREGPSSYSVTSRLVSLRGSTSSVENTRDVTLMEDTRASIG